VITKLCEIAQTYRTDKAGWYTPFYSLLFEPRRQEIKKVLEVGIGTKEAMSHVDGYLPGASLFMWRDYFPRAEVWGVDLDPAVMVLAPGIRSVHSDSRNPELPAKLPSDFDLIVDDGSHSADAQADTFVNLINLVRDGGLYIVEDAEEWRDLSDRLEGYTHHIVLSPLRAGSGKLIVIQK
jgi:hypothetical protein